MSQKNIERQELSMTPLEIARNRSFENLKIYGLGFGNGFGNLNFISKIKHSFRTENPNVDYFDDYSASFYDALKNFQRNNGLSENGILDMDTIVKIDKIYPNTFNNQEKTKILKYIQEKNRNSIEVVKATKIELAKHEADLVSDGLRINKNEALLKVKNSFNLSGSVSEMQTQILNIQKVNKLPETGKIDERMIELANFKEYFTSENIKISQTLEMSKEYQNKVFESIEKFGVGASVNQANIKVLCDIIKPKLQTKEGLNFETKYGEFFRNLETKVITYQNSPEGQRDLENANANRDSVYGIVKKIANGDMNPAEGIKELATNPTLLLTAGALFLFGVIGPKNSYTDGFFKRAGWLLGIGVFGPDAWKALGGDELLKDIGKGFSEVGKEIKSPEAQKAKTDIANETHNFIVKNGTEVSSWVEKKYNEVSNGVKSGTSPISKEDVEKKIYDSANAITNSIYAKNIAFSNSKNESEKSKAIEKDDFSKISSVLHKDEKFNNELIANIEAIKSEPKKLKEKLENSTKNEIFPENLTGEKLKKREQDLATFVTLFLDNKKSSDVYISDIWIKEKNFWEEAKDTLIGKEIKVYFKDDEKLNKEIGKIISTLPEKNKSEVMDILSSWNFGSDENSRKINEILTYINKNNLTAEEKTKVELLKNIYLMQYEFEKFSKNIEKIDINGGKNSLQELGKEKTEIYEKWNKISLGGKGSEVNNIFVAKIDKKYQEARNNIIKNNQELREDFAGELELSESYEKLNLAYSKIDSLPALKTFENYKNYTKAEKMLAYDDIIKIFEEKYSYAKGETPNSLNSAWLGRGLKIDEETGIITGNIDVITTEEKMIVDILKKGSEIKHRYLVLRENLKNIIDNEIKTIDKLTKEIEENKNPKNFELRFPEYSAKMSSIFGKFYPNNMPSEISDFEGWVRYLSDKNKVSVVKEILDNVSSVNAKSEIQLSEETIMTSISKLKSTLESKKENVKKEGKEERLNNKIESQFTIKEDYIKFYDKYIEELNTKKVPDTDPLRKIPNKDMENITFRTLLNSLTALKGNLDTYNKGKSQETKVDISKFNLEFVSVSEKVTSYVDEGKIF